MPQTSDLLEKSALIFLYNFHREHSLLKLIIKKLSPKINVKNIKKSSLIFRCFFQTKYSIGAFFVLMHDPPTSFWFQSISCKKRVIFTVAYFPYNIYFLDHSRKMMREKFHWNEMLNWWLPGCNKNNNK